MCQREWSRVVSVEGILDVSEGGVTGVSVE